MAFLAVMVLWSQIKCFVTDPGFVKNALTSKPINEEDNEREIVALQPTQDINRQFPFQQYETNSEMLIFAKQPLLSNQDDLESQQMIPLRVQLFKPKTKDQKKIARFVDNNPITLADFSQFRYCNKCNEVKPPRSHHCSICKQCVMRMDHHCPWVGNCVGLKNHKFFWNYTLYTSIACLQVVLTIIFDNSVQSMSEQFRNFAKDFNLMAIFTLCLSFCIAVGGLCIFHTYLILNNLSTIEMNVLFRNNIYTQRSKYQNWIQIFGPNWKTWFFPIDPQPPRTVDGIQYPLRPPRNDQQQVIN